MAERIAIYDDSGVIGLLLPDQRIRYSTMEANTGDATSSSTAGSDYTENGRRPGVPTFDQSQVAATSTTAGDLGPMMALEALGEQDAYNHTMRVVRGGAPGSCEVLRRTSEDGTPKWRGMQTRNVITHLDITTQIATGSAPESVTGWACTTSHSNIAVFITNDSAGDLFVTRYNPETRAVLTSGSIQVSDSAPAFGDLGEDISTYSLEAGLTHGTGDLQCIDVLTLPTGRLVLFALALDLSDGTSDGTRNVATFYSDDEGLTWRTGTFQACDTAVPSGSTVYQVRAVESNGSVLLLIEYTWNSGTTYGAIQYASSDYGQTFTEIEDWQDESADSARYFAPVVDPISGIISVIYYNVTDTNIEVRRIASPFSPILSAAASVISGDTPTHVDAYAACTGRMYITWDNSGALSVAYSDDGGVSWTEFSTGLANLGTSDDYLFCATDAAGCGVYFFCDPDSVIAGGSDPYFVIFHAGGWDRLTHPQVDGVATRELEGYGSGTTWLRGRLPESYNWSKTGAGTIALETSSPFGVGITTSGNLGYYTDSTSNPHDDGVIVEWGLQVDSGGSLTADDISMEVRIEDSGSFDWTLLIRFTASQLRVIDGQSAATISTANLDLSTLRFLKLAFRKWPNTTTTTTAGFTLYWRESTNDDWTAIVEGAADVTRRSSGSTTSYIEWGHRAISSATSIWVAPNVARHSGRVGRLLATETSYGFYDDLALNTLQDQPDVLYGARLPVAPARLYVRGGLYWRGSGGPAYRGDTWVTRPLYDYPIRNLDLLFAPSPSKPWRSSADGSAMRLSWEPEGGTATHFGNSSYGVALFGCNIDAAKLRGWNGSAWVDLCGLDFKAGYDSLDYDRTGDTVRVQSGATVTGNSYIFMHDLVGATLDLGNGKLRKVASNSEGAWTNETTKRPLIRFDGADGTEPSSGTLDIWHTQALGLIHDDLTHYSKFCIEIASHSTADGYYQIGAIVMGPLAVFGYKYSRNRVVTTEPNYEVFTATDGTRTARKLGEARTITEASWVEGVDSTQVYNDSPVPDYMSARSGTTPNGTRNDVRVLEGIVARQAGATWPLVYIERLPNAPSSGGLQDKTQLAGPEVARYGRMFDPVARQATLGTERKNEVVTITGFRHEGEL